MQYPEPVWLESTTSTNSYLNEWCNRHPETKELTCVYTSYQSAGRGQRGNTWESEAGKNLLFSFVLKPDFLEVRRQFLLSKITALALQEVLSQYADSISIKWPNDIYWKNKKLCGTLIENELTGMCISRSVSGTGINVNQVRFVSDAPNPVSLYQITGKTHDCHQLLNQVLEKIGEYYTLLKQGEEDTINQRYQQALFRREGFYPYQDAHQQFMARILEVRPGGELVLEDEFGQQRSYLFKEVAFVL